MRHFSAISLLIITLLMTTGCSQKRLLPLERPYSFDATNNKLAQQHRHLSYYVDELMRDLLAHVRYVHDSSVIASTSFVYVDGEFNQSPLFALQMQEMFTYEFHKSGLPVVEYKSTDFVRVTKQGDFNLSKEHLELKGTQPIDYLLLGTITRLRSGVEINAKLVGVKSKAVVAAGHIKIPEIVIYQYLPSQQPNNVIWPDNYNHLYLPKS